MHNVQLYIQQLKVFTWGPTKWEEQDISIVCYDSLVTLRVHAWVKQPVLPVCQSVSLKNASSKLARVFIDSYSVLDTNNHSVCDISQICSLTL